MNAATYHRWLLLLLRMALGGLLVASSISKFQDQTAFREALLAYGMLPESLGTLYAAVLPWVELLIGCCLILGVFVLFASALTIPLVVTFTIANIYAMVHPVGTAADCSCLGSLVRLSHPVSLAIDFGMLLAAGLIISGWRRSGAFSVSPFMEGTRLGIDGRSCAVLKVSLLAILMLALVAAVPAKGALAATVDDKLENYRLVLLFIYEQDGDLRDEAATLSHIEVNYCQEAWIERLRYSDARYEAKELGLKALPSLLVIDGKSPSGDYAVAAAFEGSLDERQVMQTLDELLER